MLFFLQQLTVVVLPGDKAIPVVFYFAAAVFAVVGVAFSGVGAVVVAIMLAGVVCIVLSADVVCGGVA